MLRSNRLGQNQSQSNSLENLYVIPLGLLVFHSAYFAAALDSANLFVKLANGELVLEEQFKVFDAFRCWLYAGRFRDRAPTPEITDPEKLYLSPGSLCQIWVFADMRGVPAMKNAAIDMLHTRTCVLDSLSRTSLNFAYNNTTVGSALRKFCVDAFVRQQSYAQFMAGIPEKEVASDFWKETIPIIVRQGEDHPGMTLFEWSSIDRCQWHDHSGPGGQLRHASRT